MENKRKFKKTHFEAKWHNGILNYFKINVAMLFQHENTQIMWEVSESVRMLSSLTGLDLAVLIGTQ